METVKNMSAFKMQRTYHYVFYTFIVYLIQLKY